MDAINKYSKLTLPVAPTLWLEFHGTEASVAEQARMVQMIASDHGGADFSWTTNPDDRRKLWQARYDAGPAAWGLRPGALGWTTDVCVPISRLAECVTETQRRLVVEAGGYARPSAGRLDVLDLQTRGAPQAAVAPQPVVKVAKDPKTGALVQTVEF